MQRNVASSATLRNVVGGPDNGGGVDVNICPLPPDGREGAFWCNLHDIFEVMGYNTGQGHS